MSEEKTAAEVPVGVPESVKDFGEFWSHVKVSFGVATGPRIWVLKVGPNYVRMPTQGRGALLTSEMQLATRFDSLLWAQTIAACVEGSKVIRLLTKTEREAAKKSQAGAASTWVRTEPKAETKTEAESPK
jgi:hypothetical protein